MSLTNNHIDERITSRLRQGSRVEFKFHGCDIIFRGRIELDDHGSMYFVNEHHYRGKKLLREGMRYYCPLDSITFCEYFKFDQ